MSTNEMYQPWRVLITLVNLCLTGKTSGHERLRAPALQILWGIVKGNNIDFAERIWEEFAHSINTFLDEKMKLETHKESKKWKSKSLIPSVRFTKLIILHLQQTHNLHPRTGSSVHLASDEHYVGNLKFVAKGTDQEVFGMDIPEPLISSNILDAPYYKSYLNKVAAFRKQSTVKSTTTKTTSKKCKDASTTEVTESVTKKHKRSKIASKPGSKKSKKAQATDIDANPHEIMSPTEATDIQKAVEESLKPSVTHPGHPMTWVSIKELEPGKLKQLPETIGKGKSVATEEQAAHTLLHISSPASKTKDLQYEFKKRSPESSKPNVVTTEDTQE